MHWTEAGGSKIGLPKTLTHALNRHISICTATIWQQHISHRGWCLNNGETSSVRVEGKIDGKILNAIQNLESSDNLKSD